MTKFLFAFFFFVLALSAAPTSAPQTATQTPAAAVQGNRLDTLAKADSAKVLRDSAGVTKALRDSSLAKSARDSAATTKPKTRADTVIVVKHSFNHREQIITGSVIMTCLALMLVTMNNYNPR